MPTVPPAASRPTGRVPAVRRTVDRVGAWRRGVRREEGSSAIELVLVTPILIALVFGVIQAGLVWNARHTVGSAAQHGARLARTATALDPAITTAAVHDSTSTSGSADTATDEQVRASTLAFLRQTGGRGLQDPTVLIRHDGAFVTVTVSGTTLGVLPGTHVRVSGTSRTPLEGYRP